MTPFQYERTNFTNDESCPDIDPDYFNKVEEGFKDAEVSINELNEFAEDTNDHLAASDTAIAANSEALATAQNEIAVLDSFKEYDPDFSYDKYWPCFYDGIPYRSLHDDNVGPNNIPPDTLGTHWEIVGGGSGAGNVGYNFTGGQMDNGVAMYTGYKDAAQATPVDGTGGTVTTGHTFAKNTTDPIIGIADALWSKPAANCQGEGYSCPFSIDEGRRSGPAQITFDYKTLEGYVDSDAGAYVYDVDNGAILPISISLIPSTYQKAAQFLASFVPSSSKNYRLCFHVASTSVTAWGMRVDNIVIEGKRITQGAAGGNIPGLPKALITNIPGSWDASRTWIVRRGDKAVIHAVYTASGAATGTITIAQSDLLPSGLTCSAAKKDWSVIGATSSGIYHGTYGSAGTIFSVGSFGSWNASTPSAWASGSVIEFDLELPVDQWTGNGTIGLVENYEEYASNSDVSATASVTSSGFLQGFGNFGGFGSGWAVGTVWTRRVRFQQPVQWGRDELSIGIVSGGFIYDDATKRGYIQTYQSQGTNEYGTVFKAVSGDPYAVDVVFCQGGSITTGMGYTNNGDPFSALAGSQWFVKKTSAGKPGETLPNIRASYQFGAGQTIATATMAPLNYGTKIKDTNSIVTVGAGWKATFPNACDVLVEAKIEFELSSWTAGTGANLYVKRYNSAGVIQEDRVVDSRVLDVTGNTYMFLKGNTSMSVQADDYIQIVVYQTTGGNKTTGANSATCYMNIETLGRS